MNRDSIIKRIAEEIKNKNEKELEEFVKKNLPDMIEEEASKVLTIYDSQDKSGDGIHIYFENDTVYVDVSEEYGYASDWAEIPKKDFLPLFQKEITDLELKYKNLNTLFEAYKRELPLEGRFEE